MFFQNIPFSLRTGSFLGRDSFCFFSDTALDNICQVSLFCKSIIIFNLSDLPFFLICLNGFSCIPNGMSILIIT